MRAEYDIFSYIVIVNFISDWELKENTWCSKLIGYLPHFESLVQAQLECLKITNCSNVLASGGGSFKHSRFDLCTVDAKEKPMDFSADDRKNGILANALYVKPGNV